MELNNNLEKIVYKGKNKFIMNENSFGKRITIHSNILNNIDEITCF
ncbi:hypothetical protein [Tepidibacter hydrothermalis]|uniref:Uncharacterized protein n=1 Tax=Tepidibacter hydrothermalis TaxID=3036126 RepID=A0ABY8E818_9FIRM|nr:hypothetical protein [Tepidibacter hydrothermalis]WFD09038.1 hypothetical protein P4S50_11640 [Tepidibacter hydrothermalis]